MSIQNFTVGALLPNGDVIVGHGRLPDQYEPFPHVVLVRRMSPHFPWGTWQADDAGRLRGGHMFVFEQHALVDFQRRLRDVYLDGDEPFRTAIRARTEA